MRNSISHFHELEAIVECGQSDGYLRQWAQKKLDDLKFHDDFKSFTAKSPAEVA